MVARTGNVGFGDPHDGSQPHPYPGIPEIGDVAAAAEPRTGRVELTIGYVIPNYLFMSRNVSVVITDDLDGTEGADTVRFGLDGVNYEIDLSEPNRTRLEGDLAPFVAAARRPSRDSRRRSGRTASASVDRAAVRAWAREAGLTISERGRISAEIIRQYEAAH